MIFEYVDELLDCESVMSPGEQLLMRQIGKNVWDEVAETPTELAFGPQKADARKPSFSATDDAQASRDWHQDNASSPSLGVWAVTVDEAARAGLRVVDDHLCPSEDGSPKAPNHCYLDYRGLDKPQMREARLYLLIAAVARKELPTLDKGHHLAS